MDQKGDYINHQLNTSNFRNLCKFSKGQRFYNHKKTHTEFNYYVNSRPKSRSTNFGIGNRAVNSSLSYVPGPDRYNVSKFPVDQRGAKLGYGREQAIFGSLEHQIYKKTQIPSPDAYNNIQSKRKSFTLRMKLPGQVEFAVKKRVPGPGEYKTLQLNPTGKYINSKIKNTNTLNFGIPSADRPSSSLYYRTGPGSYDIFNAESNFSYTKVAMMRRNTTKNFGTSSRNAVQDRTKVNVPGPGNYESFSCFGNGFKPRVS